MKKIIIFLLVCYLQIANAFASEFPESYYRDAFCNHVGGQTEVVLEDRTRVDCLTEDVAYEVDFAKKWAESVGQSLHYAEMTNRQPGIVIIIEKIEDAKHIDKLNSALNKVSPDVKIVITYSKRF